MNSLSELAGKKKESFSQILHFRKHLEDSKGSKRITRRLMAKRLAVVTGANQGIGFCIARQLLEQSTDLDIILACRDDRRGAEAIAKLTAANAAWAPRTQLVKLDLEQPSGISACAEQIRALSAPYGGVAVLVNNAGFAFTGDATEPVAVQAAKTVRINFFGTVELTEQLLPCMAQGSRIVTVGSRAGNLRWIPNAELRAELDGVDRLTSARLNELVASYLKATADAVSPEGLTRLYSMWPRTTYGTSKIALHAYMRLLAKQVGAKHIVTVCCPGFCATNMSSFGGDKTPDQGAETPVWLALESDASLTGKFFADKREMSFVDASW
jgi:carbonyl reductase 1